MTAHVELTVMGGRGQGGYQTAKDTANTIRPYLDGFRGAWTASDATAFTVEVCLIDDEFDLVAPPELAGEQYPQGVVFRLLIVWQESIPTF